MHRLLLHGQDNLKNLRANTSDGGINVLIFFPPLLLMLLIQHYGRRCAFQAH